MLIVSNWLMLMVVMAPFDGREMFFEKVIPIIKSF